MTNSDLIPPDDPRDAAAWWFARTCAGELTPAQRQQLQAWRLASPVHDREYRAMEQVWQWTDAVPKHRLQALAQEPQSTARSVFLSRRRLLMGSAAACTVVAVGAGALFYDNWDGGKKLEFSTAQGERRTETLPDGSLLHLNTNTLLSYQVRNGKRVVQLSQGDVMFDVKRDKQHPFYVITRVGRVKVLGTRFNVRVEKPLDVLVAVESGLVSVRAEATPTARSVKLKPDMAIHITEDGVGRPEHADVAQITAWRQGKVVFRNQPLALVVREMNRYLPLRLSIADARLEQLPVAGVFNVDDASAFLEALPRSLPLRVVRSDTNHVRLHKR